MVIATGTQGTEFSLCQDDNVATLAVLDIPSNRGGCLYLKSTSGSLAKLAAIFHPSSLVSRLAAVRRPGSCYSRNSQAAVRLIADDEAGIVHLVDGPRRREAARLTHFRRSTLTALAGRSGSSGTINCKPGGQVARARRSATVCTANGMPVSTSTSMR